MIILALANLIMREYYSTIDTFTDKNRMKIMPKCIQHYAGEQCFLVADNEKEING